jgi:flagellar motility protein MotE (MotC chaperone)
VLANRWIQRLPPASCPLVSRSPHGPTAYGHDDDDRPAVAAERGDVVEVVAEEPPRRERAHEPRRDVGEPREGDHEHDARDLLGEAARELGRGAAADALAEQAEAPAEKKEIPPADPIKPSEGAAKSEAASEAKSEKKPEKEKNPNVSQVSGESVEHRFTPVEVELLQNLVKRRQELDRWEKNIEIKETALDATEKRLDDKIAQIDAMKKEVAGLLAQYNDKEDAKIRSLVKIYENMKPKDAARIFDEVEMPVLLLVIDKMPEKKIAPILAEMDSKKAKQVTIQLAEQRRVGSSKTLTK